MRICIVLCLFIVLSCININIVKFSKAGDHLSIFTDHESNVRAYCRNYDDVFISAKGSIMKGRSGNEYIDFLAGAGALNYGHNNDYIKEKLIEYIESDGLIHGLDLYTDAKETFIDKFYNSILAPRGLNYKLQFTGPTGTNAVEAALKLARKVTGRTGIFAFMGGFHGMTMGALSATSNIDKRMGAALPLNNVTFIPYPAGPYKDIDTIEYIRTILEDTHSGIELPAAVILETIQAEGGVNPAPIEWLRKLSKLLKEFDILMICDDIQAGCGRTGTFFSFERAGIIPDMVTISKSISGYGLPMSLVLLKPELDIWKPAEHNGTFRGHQLAFVGASAAIDLLKNENLPSKTADDAAFIEEYLNTNIASLDPSIEIRGVGMIWGIDLSACDGLADKLSAECYKHNLIVETAGRKGNVLKLLPALTIEREYLSKGLAIIWDSLKFLLDKV